MSRDKINRIKKHISIIFLVGLTTCQDLNFETANPPILADVNVDFYLTTAEQSSLLELQTNDIFPLLDNDDFTITVIDNSASNNAFQTIDGFGFALTGGSAMHINNMSSSARDQLLKELFSTENDGIGINYLRVSIGSSDLDVRVFSYNDLPAGQTDVDLNNFSIAQDRINLIPVLKEILEINPDIKIMATPWSAPPWMKDNNSFIAGNLQPQYYSTYANYFVKYIQAMEAEGIQIDTMSIQNEPESGSNNPSMFMTANEQKDFIVNHLGPAFQANNITTEVLLFDHNCDNPNYPISILNDSNAKSFVSGSAFHLYDGEIEAMSFVKNAHPDRDIYFTEQWVEAPGNFPTDLSFGIQELIIGATRNWSKTVIKWNLAADSDNRPFSPNGGCTRCLGAVTINGNSYTRNSGYYIIAQASKFVPRGSRRIESNTSFDLPNVAFKTPDNKIVVIVYNNNDIQQSFNINVPNEPISLILPAGAAATLVW